jgi:hypothetical protein
MSDTRFLTPPQLAALERAIARARAETGIQREPTSDGEAIAYQFRTEIQWAVNTEDTNAARGSVPLTPAK